MNARITRLLLVLVLATFAMAQTPVDAIKIPFPTPVDEMPLGIGFLTSSREAKERILALPGAKLLAQPGPGKMLIGNVRFENFPADLFVIYDGDSIFLMSFQFTRSKYGASPSLPDLVNLLMKKYGEPDRIGGDFAAFWARAGGTYMTVAAVGTSAGPSVDFTNRATLDRKEKRPEEAVRPAGE